MITSDTLVQVRTQNGTVFGPLRLNAAEELVIKLAGEFCAVSVEAVDDFPAASGPQPRTGQHCSDEQIDEISRELGRRVGRAMSLGIHSHGSEP